MQKDLQSFIDVYINGLKKKGKETDAKEKLKKNDDEAFMTFKNLSLLSESNSMESLMNRNTKFLNDNVNIALEKRKSK